MNPRLVSLNGSLERQVLALQKERFVIGRNEDNDLMLPGLEVSRHHCELKRWPDGRFEVVDLYSRHGVLVNGQPVWKRRLAHGDLLTIGKNVLLFLLDDPSETRQCSSPKTVVAGSTVTRRPTEEIHISCREPRPSSTASSRLARDLQSLLTASRALQGAHSLDSLASCALKYLIKLTPSERAVFWLEEPALKEMSPILQYPPELATDSGKGPPSLAPVLTERLLNEKVGVLALTEDGTSLLAVPLMDHLGEVVGFLYADRHAAPPLEEKHLELVGALGALASPALQNVLHLRELEAEKKRLQQLQLQHQLVGESPAMKRLLSLIAKVARTDTTILIRGESGTGKELLAKAIHCSSLRSLGPFVAINCATLSDTLLESELFGHERGAFTGAYERRIGKLEVARGGTLFLDEVGELKPELQAKLLRVLQERQFDRIGGNKTIDADVRIVAATHRDLEEAIRAGSFREDLYYRLKVITLESPALRERRCDIPLLAQHFLAVHGRRLGRRISLSSAARKCLKAYVWPGNVRELGNVIERAVVLADSDVLHPEDLPAEVVEAGRTGAPELHLSLVDHQRKLVLEAWKASGGSYATAASTLGVHVNSLHRMVARLGIRAELGR